MWLVGMCKYDVSDPPQPPINIIIYADEDWSMGKKNKPRGNNYQHSFPNRKIQDMKDQLSCTFFNSV